MMELFLELPLLNLPQTVPGMLQKDFWNLKYWQLERVAAGESEAAAGAAGAAPFMPEQISHPFHHQDFQQAPVIP
jgi:hypothetical protein